MSSASVGTHPSTEATLLGSEHGGAPVRQAEEHAPTSVGRYVVVCRLGAGAMGSVYEARDVDLDRAVALKLVRAGLSESARQRMQREALALARLSHPNVVQIYEIGRAEDGRTFIAMELVRGQTLEAWQRCTPRPGWREALRRYAQAGEGLAAAHAMGLVHRDFKPGNCMLGDDGRVRVVDFGLVKEVGDDPDAPLPTASHGDDDSTLPTLELTRTGSLLGTPAYMAPEQLGRDPVDATADQFAFCVALYEALYGQRPFTGDTPGALLYAVVSGRVQPAPREPAVPGWVRTVLLRGLAAEPSRRWPSMRALLDALADDPALRRRKWWRAGGVLAVLGGGAVGAALLAQRDAQQCQGAEARLAGVWDDERRAAVEHAILDTGLPYAPDTAARVRRRLDDYAHAWAIARADACEATRRGEQSDALLDLRMACLDERRLHLRATVDELAQASPKVVERAVQAVLGLPRLARCEDVEALTAAIAPPDDPVVAAQVAALDERLVEVEVKRKAGKYDQGLALADAVVAEAEALGYEPLLARAWLRQGRLLDDKGQYEAALTTLERAYDAAVAHRMLEQAAEASSKLVWVQGLRLLRYEEARAWARHAEPLSRASRSELARATYLTDMGAVATSEGNRVEAREHLERALALKEEVFGPEDPEVALALANLAVVLHEQADYAKVREHEGRALDILERTVGPEHPLVAYVLGNMGNSAERTGDHAKAREHLERALALKEKTLGPDHPEIASALGNLAAVALAQGEQARGRAHLERALAIRTKALGPEHPEIADTLGNLAVAASAQGEEEQARAWLERAVAIRTKALGPDHPSLGILLGNLGGVEQELGEHELAREHLERALALKEKALGPDHPDIGLTLGNLGLLANAQGDRARAREYLERALALHVKALGPEHPHVATTLDNLASMTHDDGEHARALAEYQRALVLREKALGPDHPALGYTLTGLGSVLVDLDRPAEAIGYLERALALRTSHEVAPGVLALTRFGLARALWAAPIGEGRDRDRARELARLARQTYAQSETSADGVAAVDAWLAKVGEPR